MKYYLAIDIGASSGRHIIGNIESDKLKMTEVYRFSNRIITEDGKKLWDLDRLYKEVVSGIKKSIESSKVPYSLGIDTWAVDYVLLDDKDCKLECTYSYRDERVDNVVMEVLSKVNIEELYSITGIQFQKFNSLFQLYATERELINKSKTFMMIPDYFHYLLCGIKTNEYTNLTTTQLINIKTKSIDNKLLSVINKDHKLFPKMIYPKTIIGKVHNTLTKGNDIKIIAPPTHDTASAFKASCIDDAIIISSGTWSLVGVINEYAIVNKEAREYNFTNEGSENGYRFLKNVMGLWIIQEVRRNLKNKYSFSEMVRMARKNVFNYYVDINNDNFICPDNMIVELLETCNAKYDKLPENDGELFYLVYNSLAYSYKEVITQIEEITNKDYKKINIVGGGCQNELLNELTMKLCKKDVYAGPVEATAIGNLVTQIETVEDINVNELIMNSFEIKEYKYGE